MECQRNEPSMQSQTFHVLRRGQLPSPSGMSPSYDLNTPYMRQTRDDIRVIRSPGINQVAVIPYFLKSLRSLGTPTSPAYIPCHSICKSKCSLSGSTHSRNIEGGVLPSIGAKPRNVRKYHRLGGIRTSQRQHRRLHQSQ